MPRRRAEAAERRHARDRAQPAAAQPLQQDRFELVVGVMSGEQDLARFEPVGQRRIARFAGGGLGALPRDPRHDDTDVVEGNAVRRRKLATRTCPVRGIGLQRVIDVDRPQARVQPARAGQLRQRDEQDRGVESAAQCDAESRSVFAARRRHGSEQEIEACGQALRGEHELRARVGRDAAQLAAR